MPEGKPVKVAAAKGRPMLSWVGKRPLREVRAFPAQAVERFSAAGAAAASVSAEVDWTAWPYPPTEITQTEWRRISYGEYVIDYDVIRA